MKTERRHELKTNQLADWLGDLIERIEPHSRLIVATLAAAAVLIGVWFYYRHQAVVTNERAWDDVLSAMDEARTERTPETLQPLAERYGKTAPGIWARLRMADMQLGEGMEALFNDRDAATTALNSAVTNYKLARSAATQPTLQAHATYGLGQAYEALNQLDEAKAEYRKLFTTWPGSDFAAVAQQREADLNRPQAREFYEWFAMQRPTPLPDPSGMPSMPLDFDHGNLPGDESGFTLPSSFLPEATTPTTPTETNPPQTNPDGTPPAEAPNAAPPADDATTPQSTTPAAPDSPPEPTPPAEPAPPEGAESPTPTP